jgi:flagellar basal body-associated protein FliL
MIRRIVLITSLLVLVLLCAGCLTTPWDGDTATLDEQSAPSSAGSGIFSGNARYPVPTIVPTYAPGYTGELETDQKIIRTASVNLEVGNVTTTLDPLKGIAIAHGGYIGSMSVNTRYGDRLYAVMTIRVPASSFDSTITTIKTLGTLKSESLSADDVTEEYVDLQARRTALASQLAQYNRIMEKAENVSEILEVQVQIERVQVELDRIDGRLKYLDNRVDYGTITVTLEEPEPVGGGEGFSLVSVINESIAGFLAVTAGLVIILISIIPLVILGIITYIIYRWWKGRKGEKQKVPGEKKKEGNPPGQ